jgi:hypothetical protein
MTVHGPFHGPGKFVVRLTVDALVAEDDEIAACMAAVSGLTTHPVAHIEQVLSAQDTGVEPASEELLSAYQRTRPPLREGTIPAAVELLWPPEGRD